jgi:glycosyltransferase involved in cell wall biosynthesis
MPAVYSAFDVFALPSHREGFSRSAMEAAACGRPMVLTDIRGCREIGTDGEQLLLVAPRNVPALADALARLLTDAGLRERLGSAAGARAGAAFDQRRVARVSVETYAAVARRRGLGWRVG